MGMRRNICIIIGGLLFAAAIGLLILVLQETKMIAGHVPLFATIIIVLFVATIGIYVYGFWPVKKSEKDGQGATPKIPLDLIIPKLQVTPSDIIDNNIAMTAMVVFILNYSEYVAKNVSVDVKFGDSLWKNDLWKASSMAFNNKLLAVKDDPLVAEILSTVGEIKVREMLKGYLEHPIIDELKPGAKHRARIFDVNKDWVLKQKMFFGSRGKSTPIKPEESTSYRESQGWKEQIDNIPSGEPIKISLHTVWHNEIDKKFDQTDEFQLICTKIETGRSYTFLPTGSVVAGL
jgi:hypothetical protein